ncbi:MAG: pyridoxal phosphate-dependent aminotransferase [Kiritimatiellia bacterium]|jgi:aspartate aminotransferase
MHLLNPQIQAQLGNSSAIRKMFETGIELRKKVGADKVCDFSLGNPDVPPPPAVRTALLDAAETVSRPFSLGYPPNAGLPSLRAALAKKLSKEQDTPLEAAHVLVTCGAAGAITSFFRAVLEPGDEILVPSPYFVEYGAYCGHFGGVLKAVPSKLPDFAPDVDAFAEAMTPRTRAILLNNPNNPTGCLYSTGQIAAIGALLEKANSDGRDRPVFLLSDEPYRFLVYDGMTVPPALPVSPYAVVFGSFSKTLSLAGERIGYIAVNPAMPGVADLLAACTMTIRTLGFVNAPVIGQKIAEYALDSGVSVDLYQRRRDAMAKVLEDAGIEFAMPRGAFYFFPKAPGGDEKRFVELLQQEYILAVPGSGFGLPGHFRLSFAVDEEKILQSAEGFQRAAAAARA